MLNEQFDETLSDIPPENADSEYAERVRELTERFGNQFTHQEAETE